MHGTEADTSGGGPYPMFNLFFQPSLTYQPTNKTPHCLPPSELFSLLISSKNHNLKENSVTYASAPRIASCSSCGSWERKVTEEMNFTAQGPAHDIASLPFAYTL